MIKISANNGNITWNEYELHARLKHDEFRQQYPDIPFVEDKWGNIVDRTYTLPTFKMNEQLCRIKVRYFNRHLVLVTIAQVQPQNEVDFIKYRLNWISAVHNFLRSQLGEPSEISRPQTFGEEEEYDDPKEYTDLVVNWEYIFLWGKISMTYEGLSTTHDIYISYNKMAQIRNWDELKDECEYLIQNSQLHNDQYLSKLIETQKVIEIICLHFDYQSVKPFLDSTGGMGFESIFFPIRVGLEIYPDRREKKYMLTRGDTIRKAYAHDEDTLIQNLHLFITSETL